MIFFCMNLINLLFLNPKLELLVHFFRYLNAAQLNVVVKNLLKYNFLKNNKINSSKF